MIKAGLTGGIGSGKTTVSKIFEGLGVPVFNADSEAKEILYKDHDAIRKVYTIFGNDAFTDHLPDRKKLASIVFNDNQKLNLLNSIIHPAVRAKYLAWTKDHSRSPYTIKEAAILFESGTYKDCDVIITVFAQEDIRIKRIVQRDQVRKEDVVKRMQAQWNDQEKIERSDFVIYNDDTQLVIPQVIKIHEDLIRRSTTKG